MRKEIKEVIIVAANKFAKDTIEDPSNHPEAVAEEGINWAYDNYGE